MSLGHKIKTGGGGTTHLGYTVHVAKCVSGGSLQGNQKCKLCTKGNFIPVQREKKNKKICTLTHISADSQGRLWGRMRTVQLVYHGKYDSLAEKCPTVPPFQAILNTQHNNRMHKT